MSAQLYPQVLCDSYECRLTLSSVWTDLAFSEVVLIPDLESSFGVQCDHCFGLKVSAPTEKYSLAAVYVSGFDLIELRGIVQSRS